MIYITLTDFYNNFYINQSIFRLYKEHPDMFKEPTAIVGSSGSFPFNYWNGGYNSNEGKFLLKVEYEDLAPLFYIQNKFLGNINNIKLEHIVIDEAQDLGEFQFYIFLLVSYNFVLFYFHLLYF